MTRITALVIGIALALPVSAAAEPATFTLRVLTPETALRAAQAALGKCRSQDYQVAVAVVDRMGVVQVVLRDRFAGPHTVETAANKGWTAVSLRLSTLALAEETQAGKAASGVRHLPRFVAVGGGVPVEAGGSLLGAVGVSGAPSGIADDACARAGIDAIRDSLEF